MMMLTDLFLCVGGSFLLIIFALMMMLTDFFFTGPQDLLVSSFFFPFPLIPPWQECIRDRSSRTPPPTTRWNRDYSHSPHSPIKWWSKQKQVFSSVGLKWHAHEMEKKKKKKKCSSPSAHKLTCNEKRNKKQRHVCRVRTIVSRAHCTRRAISLTWFGPHQCKEWLTRTFNKNARTHDVGSFFFLRLCYDQVERRKLGYGWDHVPMVSAAPTDCGCSVQQGGPSTRHQKPDSTRSVIRAGDATSRAQFRLFRLPADNRFLP